jgi:Tfp pilus assembly PilM family ATPase
MAASTRNCLGVDIGSQWLRVAVMEMGKSGPRVTALLEKRLTLNPGHSDAQRAQAIAKQLQELIKVNKVRARRAVFSVPGQTVFVRQFALPKSSPERMRRMVSFEARQRVPFPLDKTIMEYQLFESEQANEHNVLLVAIKRDFISNFMRLVRRTGLAPLAISVSSIALYNFHEVNTASRELSEANRKKREKDLKAAQAKAEKEKKKQEKAGKNKTGAAATAPSQEEALPDGLEGVGPETPTEDSGFEEIQAYVNLGASLMDLAIPKAGKNRMIGFTRSVPLAGNEMDRVIAAARVGKDRVPEAKDLDAAREDKEHGGERGDVVALASDFQIDGDPTKIDMQASQEVTRIADRIVSELRRSLDYYISQPDGVAVDAIVLSGGLSRLRRLASYLEEKMGVPVKLAEVQNKQISLPGNAPDPFSPFVMAVGLGMQGLGVTQNTINFLPEDIKNIQNLQGRRVEMVGMAAMTLAMIGLSWGVGSDRIAAYAVAASQMQDTISRRTQESDRIRKIQERHQKVSDAYQKMAEAAMEQDYWFDFLKQFMDHRPPEILIDQIICRLDGNVIVRGKSPEPYHLSQFLDAIKVMSKGQAKTPNDPEGSFPVELNGYQQTYDPRYRRSVVSFEVTIKTFMRIGHVRTFGQGPTAPALNPEEGTAPGSTPVVRSQEVQ